MYPVRRPLLLKGGPHLTVRVSKPWSVTLRKEGRSGTEIQSKATVRIYYVLEISGIRMKKGMKANCSEDNAKLYIHTSFRGFKGLFGARRSFSFVIEHLDEEVVDTVRLKPRQHSLTAVTTES